MINTNLRKKGVIIYLKNIFNTKYGKLEALGLTLTFSWANLSCVLNNVIDIIFYTNICLTNLSYLYLSHWKKWSICYCIEAFGNYIIHVPATLLIFCISLYLSFYISNAKQSPLLLWWVTNQNILCQNMKNLRFEMLWV